MTRWIIGWMLVLAVTPAIAEPVRVAVASNFLAPLERIADAYAAQGGPALQISAGATGQHYAQIVNGAPYDVFLAADQARPERLVAEGYARPESRFSYAVGRLVLWAGARASLPDNGLAGLAGHPLRRLAIANPELAPYGQAARQALEATGQWSALSDDIIQGQNVGQAFQYLATGNVSHALVAASYTHLDSAPDGDWVTVDARLHDPVRQDAVILEQAPNPEGAERFVEFLQGPVAGEILASFGYQVAVPTS